MTEFWSGFMGTVLGASLTLFAQWLQHRWETSQNRSRDEGRKALLAEMLNSAGPEKWRSMEALSGVIGASREETALLLIDIGARGSETDKDVWALKKHHPLP